MWYLVFPAALLVLLAVLLIRTAMFRPAKGSEPQSSEVQFDGDAAVEHLRSMIRLKTVSYSDTSLEDEAEFERFRALLKELYPEVYAHAEQERLGRTCVLLKLKGTGDGQPSVFMAHYDVVPPLIEAWQRDPFGAEIVDGVLWGRGTLDTKCTLLGIMEATETLLKQGFTPKNDIYLAFSGDEETTGYSASKAVEALKARGITPAFVLDEGGAVVENVFPGVSERCALIGIAEKGLMNVDLTLKTAGGHASTPPARSNIGRLADAVSAVEKHPFKAKLTKPILDMFDILGRRSGFAYRLIFSNLWLFKGVLDAICRKSGGELNAMLRTTCAFTRMKGSDAYNVLAPSAQIGANLRIIGGETRETVHKHLNDTIGNADIEVSEAMGMDPSPVSDTDCAQYRELCEAIRSTWPDALVSPYLMLACSDARHYSRISPYVYRFSAMALSREERSLIHGNNERIPVETVKTAVAFFMRIIRCR